jgi:histidyl-tRNA synthetase
MNKLLSLNAIKHLRIKTNTAQLLRPLSTICGGKSQRIKLTHLTCTQDARLFHSVSNGIRYNKEAINAEKILDSTKEKHEFLAETKKLLDIVAKSLYSEKEVFIRELISNASDAIEKAKYVQLSGSDVGNQQVPFEIKISANDITHTLTIQVDFFLHFF